MAQEPEEEDFDGGEGEPEFEGGGGGGRKKLILLIVLPLVLVLGGGAAAYFSGLADPLIAMITGKKKDAAAADGKKQEAAKPAAEGAEASTNAVFYDLPEMLVNINSGRKRSVMKVRVSLELGNEQDVSKIDNVLPRIVDSFQVYLRELRPEDLQGAGGMFRLREELLTRVNAAVRPAQVKDVLFKDLLIQ
jgi:flagellar FliL protein